MAAMLISSAAISSAKAESEFVLDNSELSAIVEAGHDVKNLEESIKKLSVVSSKEKDPETVKILTEVIGSLENTRTSVEKLRGALAENALQLERLSKLYNELVKRYSKCNACVGHGNSFGKQCSACGGTGVSTFAKENIFTMPKRSTTGLKCEKGDAVHIEGCNHLESGK